MSKNAIGKALPQDFCDGSVEARVSKAYCSVQWDAGVCQGAVQCHNRSVAALFLSCLFVFKFSNALDGFGPDMDFIDSFACLWFSRFFHLYTFPQGLQLELYFSTL